MLALGQVAAESLDQVQLACVLDPLGGRLEAQVARRADGRALGIVIQAPDKGPVCLEGSAEKRLRNESE